MVLKNDARALSLKVLLELNKSDYTLDRIFDHFRNEFESQNIKDTALSKNIIFGVLRWRNKIDWIIQIFSKTPVKKMDVPILNILRIGIYQIHFLEKIPDSASVNTSVEMAKKFKGGRLKGFVNGVLRSSIRDKDKIKFPDIDKDPVKHISVKYSFPEWLIKRWIDADNVEKTIEKCIAVNTIPDISIKVNTLKTDEDKLIDLIKNSVCSIKRSELTDSISFSKPVSSIPELPGFKKGFFKVQDEAANLVCEFLSPKPGEKILDACAGIGGKTGTIGILMKNSGRITAVDNVKFKLNLLKEEMERLGITIFDTLLKDLSKDKIKGNFDKIFIDAPCSGSGVIRRNPDSKWSLSKSKIKRNASKQLKILNNLSDCVKKNGIIVYTVCSNEKEENEDVIDKFLKQNNNYSIDIFSFNEPSKDMLIIDDKYLKTSVTDNGMDGFFAVRLRRN